MARGQSKWPVLADREVYSEMQEVRLTWRSGLAAHRSLRGCRPLA